MLDLTPEAATDICMNQCRAMCCQGPLILRLVEDEPSVFEAKAAALGLTVKIDPAPGGGGWVKFAEHPGERCPMLEEATSACRIYEDRPRRCRSFPERPTPGCAISGWEDTTAGLPDQ